MNLAAEAVTELVTQFPELRPHYRGLLQIAYGQLGKSTPTAMLVIAVAAMRLLTDTQRAHEQAAAAVALEAWCRSG